MKYEDAYNKLNAIERQKISQAVYFGHDSLLISCKRFYNISKRTDAAAWRYLFCVTV